MFRELQIIVRFFFVFLFCDEEVLKNCQLLPAVPKVIPRRPTLFGKPSFSVMLTQF